MDSMKVRISAYSLSATLMTHDKANEDVFNALMFSVRVKYNKDAAGSTVLGWLVACGSKGVILYEGLQVLEEHPIMTVWWV